MIKEILGALEFAAFLAAIGAACVWVSRMPWYRRLSEKLFPEVSDGEDTDSLRRIANGL